MLTGAKALLWGSYDVIRAPVEFYWQMSTLLTRHFHRVHRDLTALTPRFNCVHCALTEITQRLQLVKHVCYVSLNMKKTHSKLGSLWFCLRLPSGCMLL